MCTSLINDVVTYYNSIDKKNLELVVDVDPTTPTLLNGDIKKIHKLFRHLLNNAVKFTRRGGVYIKVFPIVRDYGVNLVIEVTDTGKGMILKRFRRDSIRLIRRETGVQEVLA